MLAACQRCQRTEPSAQLAPARYCTLAQALADTQACLGRLHSTVRQAETADVLCGQRQAGHQQAVALRRAPMGPRAEQLSGWLARARLVSSARGACAA